MTDHPNASSAPHVALYVTCLVDLVRARVGEASVTLLEQSGCRVTIPAAQTCCGQPGLNSGAKSQTVTLAKNVIKQFESFDYVVVPSGSCAATIKKSYPQLLKPGSPNDDPQWHQRAIALAEKTWELFSFLVEIRNFSPADVKLDIHATYHDSCSGLRELGIHSQPRRLLYEIDGLKLTPLPGNDVCCGFGGTFCITYSDISNAIVTEKAHNIDSISTDLLLGGDLGCLVNMAGKLSRQGSKVRVMHAAEVLAGMGNGPAIGEEG